MRTDNILREVKTGVREGTESDIPLIADYWYNSPDNQLRLMGVDISLRPPREILERMLYDQLALPYEKKNSCFLIWMIDGKPRGHCNTNPTLYGKEAWMHLHLWNAENRLKGNGTELLRESIPYFFHNLKLKTIYSMPYALNPAPHRALEKAGFHFVKEYITKPGAMNFEQPVKLWRLDANEP